MAAREAGTDPQRTARASCPTSTPRRPPSGSSPSTRAVDERGRERARYLMLRPAPARPGEGRRRPEPGRRPTTSTRSRPSTSRGSPVTRRPSGPTALDPLERGGHGAPRPARRDRRRRPHLDLRLVGDPVRGRLQPLLPRQGPRRRRRPDLHPGPRLARGLRAGLPRGAAHRGPARRVPAGEVAPRRRAAVLPAPAADAGLLGVPDRLDGPRPDQRDLPGAVQQVPARPRASRTPRSSTSGRSSATARWTSRRAAARCSIAAYEELDNLTFVVNCNLQRLDGPVRGNGKIIQELEAFFRGAGWNVDQGRSGAGSGTRCSPPTATRRAREPDEHHPGRRLPDVPGRGRRLHPRELLRPGPAHPASSSSR